MNIKEFIKLLEETRIPAECKDMTPYLQPLKDALLEVLPPRLYRFRSINECTLSALDKDLIFFSRAKDFNDPYDTLISSNSFEALRLCPPEILNAFMHIMGDQVSKGMEIPDDIKRMFPQPLLDQMLECVRIQVKDAKCGKREEPNWEEVFDNLNNIVTSFESGLRDSETYACFSESIKSMTMWAHYADYHKGFALSYNLKELGQSNPNNKLMVFPIIYSAVRYDATNLLAWGTAQMLGLPMTRVDQLDKIKSALYKSLDWEYEKEWRIINPLDDGNPHPSFKYAPIGIYYGSRISEINKKILHNIAVEKGLEEYEMYIDRSSSDYEMKIKPFSI